MLIQLFSSTFRIRALQCWMMSAVLLVVASSSLAQEMPLTSPPPVVSARAAVLLNPVTGDILYAKEPHLRLPPASTTKVLTALVTLERLDLNIRVPVSPQAASAAPSRIGLHAGEAVSVQDLLYGLLLKSGNDAAETLAEAAGGSVPDFANLMNGRAWQLGARDSHFMNPHGLPNDDHYTTAYDLALIFSQAMNHPVFSEIVRTHSAALRIESGQHPDAADWRLVPVRSHNRLLDSYEGARGGKTGFTLKARRCFVGEVDRGGVRLIVAILNSPNSGTLWQDARDLFDYGFARYGLALPPPVRPAPEPEPVMVQRASIMTPVAARTVVTRPALEERGRHPVAKGADVSTRFSSNRAATVKVTAPARPVTGRMAKSVTVDKAKKPAAKVVSAKKPDKQQTTKVKVATRSEQTASGKQAQKNIKRRG